jgi:hypothetical protein
VVIHAEEDPLTVIDRNVTQWVDANERDDVYALVIEELRRLHEGTLARYGLRPSEFLRWRERRGMV